MRRQAFWLITAVLLALPARSAWAVNAAGLAAMRVCAGGEDLAALADAPAFFRAGAADCLGLAAQADAAYLEAVSAPQARLAAVRAARPLDVALASAAAAHNPDQPQAHFWLAQAAAAAGDTAAAIAAYEAGLALDPANGEEWENLGRLYEAAGDVERAVRAFDFACLYVDQGKNGCPNAARLHFARGEYHLAEQRWRDTLEQLPGWEPGWRGLAETLLAQGRDSEAQEILRGLESP
jgi:tetratricopeptide (TPR) repeat protein